MEGRAMKSGMEMMLDSMGIQTGAIKQLLDPANIKALLSSSRPARGAWIET
jgi:hypothetical protein